MNPFLESTVARPLAETHPEQRWASRKADARRQLCDEAHKPLYDLADGRASSMTCPDSLSDGTPDADSRVCPHRAERTGRARGKSLWAALGLGLSMLLTAGSATVTQPVALTGAVALAGILMPRDVQAVDLNQASVLELQAVSGIGPKTAAMIVNERTRGGNFSSLSDLSDRVRGIGPKKAAALDAAGLKVESKPEGKAKTRTAASTSK